MAMTRCKFLFLLTGLLASACSFASEITVSPVRVDLATNKSIVPVTLYNAGNETVVMETSVKAWKQSGETGQWLLLPTTDVLAYPGLVRIQPKSSAVVRVGRAPLAKAGGGEQLTYRLFLRELADPRPETGKNVRIVLNINLPVFFGPGSATNTDQGTLSSALLPGRILNFSYTHSKTGQTISPQNATYVWLTADGKQIDKSQGRIDSYILPGGVGKWNTPLPKMCRDIAFVKITGESGVVLTGPVDCK